MCFAFFYEYSYDCYCSPELQCFSLWYLCVCLINEHNKYSIINQHSPNTGIIWKAGTTVHVICIPSIVTETQKNARRNHVMQPDAVAAGRRRSSQIWHRLCQCLRALFRSWIRHPLCGWQFPTSKFAVSWICVSTGFTSDQKKLWCDLYNSVEIIKSIAYVYFMP